MKKLWFLCAALFFAGIAFAAGLQSLTAETATTERIGLAGPAVAFNGLYVGRDKGTYNVKLSKQNKLTSIYSGIFDYDFPEISPEGAIGGHLRTPNLVLAGAQIGDPCIVSSIRTSIDGGYGPDVQLRAHVNYANSVVLEAVAEIADAGSVNLVDAGYKIICFSSQSVPY